MNYLGRTSKRRSKDISWILKLVISRFLMISPVDITITYMGGKRTAKQQYAIFIKGYSKADGYIKISYHQSGMAVDVAAYINGKINNEKKYALTVVYYFFKAFEMLKEENKIPKDVYLHSGIFWGDSDLDGDGFLTEQDKIGWDARHFEIRKYPQKGIFEIKLE